MKRAVLICTPIAILLLVAAVWFTPRLKASGAAAGQSYDYAVITKGSIESVVSSSGTLGPVSEVSVLSQMSGRVEKVLADYNDRVRKGQVLVELSTDMLELEALQSQAAVDKAQASYDLQLLDCRNKSSLFSKGLLAEYDLKSSQASLQVAAAELASAQSALKVIQTKLTHYALITSPIDGIVLDKNVDVGQTVVEGSSSNATSLFTLAEDLSKMEIKAKVDELDIGSVAAGQEVRFTVEANPGVTFTGRVHEVRLVPETSDNVVSYYVMVDADNTEGKLLPGMTADIEFIEQQRTDVLLVPTAAFRFQPTTLTAEGIARLKYVADIAGLPAAEKEAALKAYDERTAAAAQSERASGTQSSGLTGLVMSGAAGGPGGGQAGGPGSQGGPAIQQGSADTTTQSSRYLWYLDDTGKLAALKVIAGASDDTNTEVSGAADLEGKTVILKVKVE